MQGKGTYKKLWRAVEAVQTAPNAIEALAAARRLREATEALERQLVITAREQRVTWTEIGEIYGTSKQGAQQRFRFAADVGRSDK
jgi:flavin-binding protein dodecin